MSMPRPKFSPTLARFAAEDIVSELIKGGYVDEVAREDCVDDLVKHGRQHLDGYELAKTLDDYAYWGCDFEMAEILNGFSHAVYCQIERAENDWAKMTSPQPPHPIGTRVKVSRGDAGEITGIYAHGAAKYLVKIDGDQSAVGAQGSRRIVNFEDAALEIESAQ